MPEREHPPPPRRKSIRLSGFDYSTPGCYFVTICVINRKLLLGRVADNTVELSAAGRIVDQVWSELRSLYPNMDTDSFVVMPHHVHGIIVLIDRDASPENATRRPHGLGEIVRAFKSISARRLNQVRGGAESLWQRGYFERVVRSERELERLGEYIDNNPIAWTNDPGNPERIEALGSRSLRR